MKKEIMIFVIFIIVFITTSFSQNFYFKGDDFSVKLFYYEFPTSLEEVKFSYHNEQWIDLKITESIDGTDFKVFWICEVENNIGKKYKIIHFSGKGKNDSIRVKDINSKKEWLLTESKK